MTQIESLFISLVRVSIGAEGALLYTPSNVEWTELYDMAKRQSLVGICFAGVQRLQAQAQAPPEMLYLKWMGMAAKIQQRNEVVNRQCVEVQKMLHVQGFEYCILKGQGVGALYNTNCGQDVKLSQLRQSGDIDVYAWGDLERMDCWISTFAPNRDFDYVHAHLDLFPDTEVELHYRFGFLFNLFDNQKLQKWFDENRSVQMVEAGGCSLTVPTNVFNAVYLMHHIYRHLFVGGVGLRQLMDYYFLLITPEVQCKKDEIMKSLRRLGMGHVTASVMWILKVVFGCDDSRLLCKPNDQEGRFLLNEIMHGGNFGKYNNKYNGGKSKLTQLYNITRYSMHLAKHYPKEALWAPIWHIYHYALKLKYKLKN